ncbi:hypothetical protein [Alloactinosynnema sp. L-07]|nr:hypothetical protein [Alloactinosynnema sp. L-07]
MLLVLGALGLLITALTTANTLWAWLSVGISVVAAAILVLDWLRNRRRAAAPSAAAQVADEPEPDDFGDDDPDDATGFDDEPEDEDVLAVAEEPSTAPTPPLGASTADDPDSEPAEEETDAADLLVVSGLSADVRVLDERPRYHLVKCGWLANRPSIALPVSEARQLGFTPCGRCAPDATLAAKHRAGRGARTTGQ